MKLERTRRQVMKYCALGMVTSVVTSRMDRVAAMQSKRHPEARFPVLGVRHVLGVVGDVNSRAERES